MVWIRRLFIQTTRVFCEQLLRRRRPHPHQRAPESINAIDIGDKVLAEDPETREQGYFEVVAVTSHPEDEILQISIKPEVEESTLDAGEDDGDNEKEQPNSDTTLEVTPEHPIYVEGKGWLWAENLSLGDRLRRSDGGWAKVLAIARVELDEPQPVYNFTVQGPHTYFVLEVGVLVHNDSCGPGGNLAGAGIWQFSLRRNIGIGLAGVNKHLKAWWRRSTPLLDHLPDLKAIRASEPFNKLGFEKHIFDVLGAEGYSPEQALKELVWLQPKEWGGPNLMEGELEGLEILKKYGLPTPRNFGKTEYTEFIGPFRIKKTAVLQERMAGGSRDYFRLEGADKLQELIASPLNERTLQDLEEIERILTEQQLKIPDLQFLITPDGRVVISDPQMPRRVEPGTDLGLTELNDLKKLTKKVISLREGR